MDLTLLARFANEQRSARMKRIETNGHVHWEWEPSETRQREAFEEALLQQKAYEILIESATTSIAKALRGYREAWAAIRSQTEVPPDVDLKYNWATGHFEQTTP